MRINKINYSRQLNKYDCVPVALVNSMKWSGVRVSYKDKHKEIKEFLNYHPEKGVRLIDIISAFTHKDAPFKAELKERINVDNVKSHLNNDGIVVLGYYQDYDINHMVLIIQDNGKIFVLNETQKKTCKIISINKLNKLINKQLYSLFLTKKVRD